VTYRQEGEEENKAHGKEFRALAALVTFEVPTRESKWGRALICLCFTKFGKVLLRFGNARVRRVGAREFVGSAELMR
jgi:hypothetical protein